jgi:2-polyprenyl-6-methoxyphenol hydroxylase-like FAD-dependent oxidoreductase
MHDVVIVGAGPVGMTVAALCASGGLDTVVVERRRGTREGSRAIGVMPASLEILNRIGVAEEMVEQGVRVRRAYVHDQRRCLGGLDFSSVSGGHPYVLVMPQVETEALLRRRLDVMGVPILEGMAVTASIENDVAASGVSLSLVESSSLQSDSTVVNSGVAGSYNENNNTIVDTAWVVCADGFHGRCGTHLGLEGIPRFMPYRFIMGDTADFSGFGADAHLWFTPAGAVESFPLTDQRRRWIAQLPGRYPEIPDGPGKIEEALERFVRERTGYVMKRERFTWSSSFQPVTRIARAAGTGRAFLAGDALHTMSPIGGQGMNTGLADAELLADLLVHLCQSRGAGAGDGTAPGNSILTPEKARRVYNTARLQSGAAAAQRAALGTHIGSLRGALPSALRSVAIAGLLASPAAAFLASHFTMRTVPYRRSLHAPGINLQPR